MGNSGKNIVVIILIFCLGMIVAIKYAPEKMGFIPESILNYFAPSQKTNSTEKFTQVVQPKEVSKPESIPQKTELTFPFYGTTESDIGLFSSLPEKGSKAKPIATIKAGTDITVFEVQGKYYGVRAGSLSGWVSKDKVNTGKK